MLDTLDFLFWAVFQAALVVVLFDSVRKIATGDTSWRSIALAVGSACICLVFAGTYFHLHIKHVEVIAGRNKLNEKFVELPDSWGGNMSVEERAKASSSWTSAAFLGTGKLLHDFDQSGNRQLLIPSQAQLLERERAVEVGVMLHVQAQALFFIAAYWFISAVTAAALGWLIGRSNKVARANPPPLNADAGNKAARTG
jgi:hypothetical protein